MRRAGKAGAARTWSPDSGDVRGRRAAPLADWIAPELCTLVDEPPAAEGWLHEIKLDGYRILARSDAGEVRLLSRNRKDWTAQFASVAQAVAELPVRRAMLDGEVAILQSDGTTSFQELQNVLTRHGRRGIHYFVFDLLHLDDFDLTATPLRERKRLLKALLDDSGSGVLRYSDHVEGHGAAFYAQACAHRLEGIISKRADSTYTSGRARDWLKIKCLQGQEFVIGGYTEGSAGRTGFGALLLGVHDEGGLRYAGKVGTGFSETSLRELSRRLHELERERMPFAKKPADARSGVHWVEPSLVAEVVFQGWTRDGRLRHPSFRGLRDDRSAAEIRREAPAALPAAAAASSTGKRAATRVAGIRITNPGKVLFPDPGMTKHELAEYYETVAPWMVPHLARRPLTLLRCPDGYEGECFFQKNEAAGTPQEVRRVHIPDPKQIEDSTYLYIEDAAGVVALLQMGVLEFHLWGSRAEHLEQPDRVTFDLDPGPGVSWEEVIEGAHLVRDTLERLELKTRVMLTGGKGLHVVLPIEPEQDWAAIKAFSHGLVQAIVRAHPARYTAHLAKVRREKKIFLDYLRNGRGSTAVAPYSTRARPGAPVAVPIGWDELSPSLRPDAFNVRNLRERMRSMKNDPWLAEEIPVQKLGRILESARSEVATQRRRKAG